MTRREALAILHPSRVHKDFIGGVYGCPHGTVAYNGKLFYFDSKDYIDNCDTFCEYCWNKPLSIQESASLLAVVGEDVIRGYLRRKHDESIHE